MLECCIGKYQMALTTNRQHLPPQRQDGGNFMPLNFYFYFLIFIGYLNTQKSPRCVNYFRVWDKRN
jgi:hypothetical protein